MTFCAKCKQDICKKGAPEGCCALSRLYGALLFGKCLDKTLIHLGSEHPFVIDNVLECMTELGIREQDIELGSNARERFLKIKDPYVIDRIMSDFGYSGDELSLRLKEDNFLCDKCRGAFVAGCFLTGGTVTAPSSGYHLEFSSHRRNLVGDLKSFLESCGFAPKEAERGYSRILYFKDSGQIEDMLTFMGAHNSSLELMNEKIYRDIVNNVNRRTNCENANIDKLVSSSARDSELIRYVFETAGESYLPENLRETARLRLRQPELSLEELGAAMSEKLTKSGVSHRLRRIRREAQRLREQRETGDKSLREQKGNVDKKQ